MEAKNILTIAQTMRELLLPRCEAAQSADAVHDYERGSKAGEAIDMVFRALWDYLESIDGTDAYDKIAEIAVGDVHFLTGYDAKVFIH